MGIGDLSILISSIHAIRKKIAREDFKKINRNQRHQEIKHESETSTEKI